MSDTTLVSFPFTAIPTVKPSLKLATHRAETKGTSPQSGFLLLFDLSPSHLSFNLLLPLPSKETQCDDITTIFFIPFQVRSVVANAWCETAGLSRPSTYLKKEKSTCLNCSEGITGHITKGQTISYSDNECPFLSLVHGNKRGGGEILKGKVCYRAITWALSDSSSARVQRMAFRISKHWYMNLRYVP